MPELTAEARPVDARVDEAGPDPATREGRPVRRHAWLHGVVALSAFTFAVSTNPLEQRAMLIDPSWEIGLGWMRSEGLRFGTDVLFSYGPLGLLAEPTWAMSRLWLALALVTHIAVAVWFSVVVVRACRGDRLLWTVGLAIGLGLMAGTLDLPELAAVALAIDVFNRLPSKTDRAPSERVVFLLAGAAGALLLTKFSAGLAALVPVGLLALAWARGPRWWRSVLFCAAGLAAAVLTTWLVLEGGLSGLVTWLRGGWEISRSYGSAMAKGTLTRWTQVQLAVVAVLAVVLAVAEVVRTRRNGLRAQWPELALVGAMGWLSLKAGFVRPDAQHVPFALVMLAALTVSATAAPRWRVAGAGVVVLTILALLADSKGAPTGLDSAAADRADQPGEVAAAVQSVISPTQLERHVEREQRELREYYATRGLDPRLTEALDGRRVYADQWDIAALWANGIEWDPIPVLQGYSAYTPWLDERDAADLRDEERGPDAILWFSSAIDSRFRHWDPPETQLAISCSFAVADNEGKWSVLVRRSDICGDPELIETVDADPGDVIQVPEGGPDELVIATFGLEPSARARALDLVARGRSYPTAVLNGRPYRFLTTTAAAPHVVRRPARAEGRALGGGELGVRDIRFEFVTGPIEVRFYRVPLG
ncbi:MAG: hypothetical protein ACJ739_01920 [Acidimicrobiales bacterium]